MSAAYCGGFDFSGGQNGLQKGRKNIYLIHLKGFRNPDMEFEKERLYSLGNVVEVTDDTRPCYDLEKLRKQQEGTLVGEYIRSFDGKEGTVEQKALYYGLQALMETDFRLLHLPLILCLFHRGKSLF